MYSLFSKNIVSDILKINPSLGEDTAENEALIEDIFTHLGQFFKNEGPFRKPDCANVVNSDQLTWWRKKAMNVPAIGYIAKLVEVLLQLEVSAAAVERVNSLLDWIHSSRANRLNVETLLVSTFVSFCLQHL